MPMACCDRPVDRCWHCRFPPAGAVFPAEALFPAGALPACCAGYDAANSAPGLCSTSIGIRRQVRRLFGKSGSHVRLQFGAQTGAKNP